jgi:hypothetical protein
MQKYKINCDIHGDIGSTSMFVIIPPEKEGENPTFLCSHCLRDFALKQIEKGELHHNLTVVPMQGSWPIS